MNPLGFFGPFMTLADRYDGATGHPEEGPSWARFHIWRWRLLFAWMVAFTIIVAVALRIERSDAHRSDQRFCGITRTFISSNIVLRNAQNLANVETIGERRAVIAANQSLIRLFQSSPSRTKAERANKRLLLTYLQTQVILDQSQNITARTSINAADTAINQWNDLRRELRC